MTKFKKKRLRIFAGPNGSGKSTLAENLRKKYPIGVFVNADEIEKKLKLRDSLSLYKYKLNSTTDTLREYLLKFGMSQKILQNPNLHKKFKIIKNNIQYSGEYNSYIAADISGFIRNQLILKGKDFSFETVFSHFSKLEIIKNAKSNGYRVYFYFLTTDDPDINVNRVNIRVAQNGHPVPEEKIRKRYYKSLDLMYDAVKLSTRAYLFDNSGEYYKMVAQIDYGKKVQTFVKSIPNWFIEYLYNKVNKPTTIKSDTQQW
ncbi:MAG: AAA family ATPase [Lutibacter sp.]|uniref:zeta toxin family protein n=1 Tax=Lutibacter sp. TaxID=1925666 RepID=UPI0038588532